MPIEVTDLTEADIPAAIEIIQTAFAEDPYFKWVFDAENMMITMIKIKGTKLTNSPTFPSPRSDWFNKQRNYDSLAVRCRWGINNAIFQVATDTDKSKSSPGGKKIVGVSCWLPPTPAHTPETWYSWTQNWLLSFRQTLNNVWHFGRGGLRTNRYWIWKERQHEAQSQIWDDPKGYYFCNIVAVHPECQGLGVGRKLFEAVTDRADQEGVKCYLESSRNVPNVQIYEKMGFEMRREMECRDGEDVCMLYCMVREPKTKSEL